MLWIMKPTSKCQGKGIFIFNKISDISKWKGSNKDLAAENYVCQRYILNPLLFGGRKFDMRIYALCLSYNPLTVYLYRNGFARFAHDHYDNADTDNLCTPPPTQTSTSPTSPSTCTRPPTSSASAASGSSTTSRTSCSASTPRPTQVRPREDQRLLLRRAARHRQVPQGRPETGH